MIPVTYRTRFTRYIPPTDLSRVTIEATSFRDGEPVKWAIREGGLCLNKQGEWEYEPLPSSPEDDFLERTRFESLGKANALLEDTFAGKDTK